jgi:hypothetical protein
MYYILAAIFIIIVYVTLTKILSSIFKGCLVTVGVSVLVILGFIFLKSTKEPVTLFNKVLIDNFQVEVLNK